MEYRRYSMYKNLFLSLAIVGMFGCGHNPEINPNNKNHTVIELEEAKDFSKKNKLYNIVMPEGPVSCYYWIPLEYIEQNKKD